MKGLQAIPSEAAIIDAYNCLHLKKVTEKKLALWSQWARLDPRLAEVITSFLCRFWSKLNPLILNLELSKQPWPQAFGIFIEQINDFGKLKNENLFKGWSECAMAGFEPISSQQFFIGQRSLAGSTMFLDSFLSIETYRVWGFLGRDVFFSKFQSSGDRTLISARTRKAALREILKLKKRFSVNDYMEFLGHHVSRRQAQLDLKNEKKLKKIGNTRGKTYRTS